VQGKAAAAHRHPVHRTAQACTREPVRSFSAGSKAMQMLHAALTAQCQGDVARMHSHHHLVAVVLADRTTHRAARTASPDERTSVAAEMPPSPSVADPCQPEFGLRQTHVSTCASHCRIDQLLHDDSSDRLVHMLRSAAGGEAALIKCSVRRITAGIYTSSPLQEAGDDAPRGQRGVGRGPGP